MRGGAAHRARLAIVQPLRQMPRVIRQQRRLGVAVFGIGQRELL